MEKRLVIFLVLSIVILTGHTLVSRFLFPPPPQVARQPADRPPAVPGEGKEGKKAEEKQPDGKSGEAANKAEAELPDTAEKTDPAAPQTAGPDSPDVAAPPVAAPPVPQQWVSIGSYDPASGSHLLVTANNLGASIERVALVERDAKGQLRYRDLSKPYGYLGMQCGNTPAGCVVKVVGAGTPAALAKPDNGTLAAGFVVGDVIQIVDDTPLRDTADLETFLGGTRPQQLLTFVVRREGLAAPLKLTTALGQYPLELVEPESAVGELPTPSYLLGIRSIGSRKSSREGDELPEFAALRTGTWEVAHPEPNEVVFTRRVKVDAAGGDELEFVKRFRLGTPAPDTDTGLNFAGYHLQMVVEIRNLGNELQTVSYALDGPNGLPREGWWYTTKIHPKWGAAARGMSFGACREIVTACGAPRRSMSKPKRIRITRSYRS